MKKYNIYSLALSAALVLAFSLLLTGCSNDDNYSDLVSKSGGITFQLSDQPSGINSKAVTKNFQTSFEVGDEAGIFIIKAGKVVGENIKITYNSYGYWSADESFDYATYADAQFYAYYPYAEVVEFDATLDDPFQTYIDTFQPQVDQSEAVAYEASDLMTSYAATVDATSRTVSVYMHHDMAMVCMELPNHSYTFSNDELPTYVVSEATDATFKFGDNNIVPSLDDATQQYRYLVNPLATANISVTYKNNGVEAQATVTGIGEIGSGNYHVEKIDGGVKLTPWTLQEGDFYMNDGTLLAKGTTLTNEQKAAVLGVVYKIGTSEPVVAASSRWCHAMVVGLTKTQNTWAPAINPDDPTTTALTSAQNSAGWKSWYSNFGLSHLISNNASASKIVIDELEETGHRNTVNWSLVPDIISSANAPKITDDSKKNFATVFKGVCQAQQESVPVPVVLCSSWYVPSLAAWMDMKNSDLTAVEASISAAGGEALGISSKLSVPYWSSNLRGHETMWGFTADGTTSDKLFTSLDMRKNSRFYRWILAF